MTFDQKTSAMMTLARISYCLSCLYFSLLLVRVTIKFLKMLCQPKKSECSEKMTSDEMTKGEMTVYEMTVDEMIVK